MRRGADVTAENAQQEGIERAALQSERGRRSDTRACVAAGRSLLTLDRDEAEQVADLFKILGDPTRVLILQALIAGEDLCVHQLADAVGMSQSSVSHHLRLLRTFGLIRARRSGREVYYRPDDQHIERLIGVCVEHVAHSRGGDHD